ncbi:MAG: hypothetical protein M3Y07_19235 [Acidobacteriota bacterium]|nr:hypothetical protein [Acidobacteriota bacterium]
MPKRVAPIECNLIRGGFQSRILSGDRIPGLEVGGDDCIAKPFGPREPTARLNVAIGTVRLDRVGHRVFLKGAELDPTSTEFRPLDFFVTHPGPALSREQSRREHLDRRTGDPKFLATARGLGYGFERSVKAA